MNPRYVNSIIMPSDARSTPRLAFMYHRYLVSSELMNVAPLSFNTGDFQRAVEYGVNNDIRGLRSLLMDNMGGWELDTSFRCIDEMCDHILGISEYLQSYMYALIPNGKCLHYQIREWGSRSIWMTVLPKYQVIESPYFY